MSSSVSKAGSGSLSEAVDLSHSALRPAGTLTAKTSSARCRAQTAASGARLDSDFNRRTKDVCLGEGPGTELSCHIIRGDITGGRLPVARVQKSPAVSPSQAVQQVTDELKGVLRHMAVEHLTGLPARMHVEVSDHTADAVVERADQLGVDAIAIGTHGRGGVRRALLGSVAEEVICKANVPVLRGSRGDAATRRGRERLGGEQ